MRFTGEILKDYKYHFNNTKHEVHHKLFEIRTKKVILS